MAEINDNGSFNLGLANIAAQNSGPNAIANQANTAANTALLQQQAQGAQIQNANARLQYQLFSQGVNHLTDFSGQRGPTLDTDANNPSGVTASSATPANAPPPPGVNPAGVKPEDDVGTSASKQAYIESQLESQYNVNPSGTPAEQQAILQAHADAIRMKLSGNKGLADAADQKVQMLKDQRDMNVNSRRSLNEVDASQHYDKLAAVEAAPNGQAFDTLTAIAPDSSALIKKQNPDATPDELDEIARDTTAHVGAFIHRFTDRPTKIGDDGALYDEKSGMRVDVPIRGVSPEKQAALLDAANKIITIKNSDGSETTEPQYIHDGYKNPNLWVTDAVAQIRSRNGAQNVVEAVGNHAAQYGHLIPGAPPVPGGSLYRGPQQSAPQPGAPQPGAPQPGAPPQQPGAQPTQAPQAAAPQQPNAPQPAVDPVLKNALNDPDYKLPVTPTQKYVSQSPAEQKEQEAIVGAKNDLFKDSAEATTAAAGALQYLQAAKAIMQSKGAPTVGLAGGAANQVSRALTALGFKTVDATNYQEVAKYLGNAALLNAKATYGAKMTQSEVKLQLEDLSPSVHMTDDAINDLLDTNIKASRYTIDSAKTVRPYLSLGGDPRSFAEWRETHWPRADVVNGPTVPTVPTRPGQQSSGAQSSSPDTGGFIVGKTYKDKAGNTSVYRGNGQWQ
jgi:hypothetical protein